MKKKLRKKNSKLVCRLRSVVAFDEGITDAGIVGFNF